MADASGRYGITIPLRGLIDDRALIEELGTLGYTDVWSSEVSASDAFTPLVLAGQWSERLRLGTAVVPVFTRGPALLAQTAAALAAAAPGRFVLGLGTSSPVIVSDWNGLAFDRPYQRARDVLRFLRPALRGEKVAESYETFSVTGFRLERAPEVPPPLYLAALREGMLRLAGAEADGVILNWLGAQDVARCRAVVEGSAGGAHREVVARIFVVPNADAQRARTIARRAIAAYLNVPAYAAFQTWLGRGPLLADMWAAWRAGDRRGAVAAIPDEVVDSLVVHGDPDTCRAHIARYADAGVDTPMLAILDPDADPLTTIRALAPAGRTQRAP